MSAVIAWIIFIAIVAAIGYGVYKAVSKIGGYVKHRRRLSPKEKQHRVVVKAPDKSIRRAESQREGRVKQARKEVEKAAAPIRIQKLGGVLLTDEYLQIANVHHPLTARRSGPC